MNGSREFQDVASICSGQLSNVPSQRAIVPSLGGMRDPSLRPDTLNLIGTSGHVFDSPRAVQIRHRHLIKVCFTLGKRSATGEDPVRESTGKPVARSEERNRETIPTPRFARRPSTLNSFFPAEGAYPQADQSRLQISEHQFYTFPTPTTSSC